MMLRTLFDERRRAEIRDALRSGRRIGFRCRAVCFDPMGKMRFDVSEEELARMGHKAESKVDTHVKLNTNGNENAEVEFPGRDDLAAEFARVRMSKNPDDWHPFVIKVRKWADARDYSDPRHTTLFTVLRYYTAVTGDHNIDWKVEPR